MPLSVKANIPTTTDLLGKHVSDLQTNVKVRGSNITGTLKYVDDYTGFSGDVAEQSGNYLAIHITSTLENVTFKSTYNNRTVTLDPDGLLVIRVVDKTKPLTISAEKSGYATTADTFNLAKLTLESAE